MMCGVSTELLTETDAGWDIPLRGASVTRCYIDRHAVGFLLDDANVYLEGLFEVMEGLGVRDSAWLKIRRNTFPSFR